MSMPLFILSLFLLIIGLVGMVLKRDVLSMLLSMELSFLGTSLLFGLIASYLNLVDGFIMILLLIAVMAVQMGLGLSLIISCQNQGQFQYKEDLEKI